jgi:dipeptidyl aminopeptidase/acylaminoacyl peptidase
MRRLPALFPFLVLLLALAVPTSPAAHAQEPAQAFTIDDAFEVANVLAPAVSPDGRWVLVATSRLRDRMGRDSYRWGDPTYLVPSRARVTLVDTRTGRERALFPEPRLIRGPGFSPDGGRVAFLVEEGDWLRLAVAETASGRVRTPSLPRGRIVSEMGNVQWTEDGALVVALRPGDWLERAGARFRAEVEGPIVVQSSNDPFLPFEEIRRFGLEQDLYRYDPATGRFEALLEGERFFNWGVSDDGRWLRWSPDITPGTRYEEIFGSESALRVRDLASGEDRELFETTRGMQFEWAGDGRSFVYEKDRALYFQALDRDEPRLLTEPEEEVGDTASAEGRDPPDEGRGAGGRDQDEDRFRAVRLSHDGAVLIASNREGLWFIDTESGEQSRFHDLPDPDDDESPRWAVRAWSQDGRHVYMSYASRTEWDRGIYRYDRDAGELRELTRGDELWTGIHPSGDGSTVVFTGGPSGGMTDVFAADGEFREVRRLTDGNPWLGARRLGEARLLDYLDVDGRKLHAILHLPPGFREGSPIPTVFIVYESFFDARFNATVALLNAEGYAVVQPSVHLERGYPGEGWLKGVTAAANKLVEMGIADPDRLGVHGTSYGGYATSLLVTQTPRFRAAINISGKTNMVSFYTDSPRLGTRNIHAPERSQDRIGATLWEQPHKYLAHSAVMAADRVTTPILFITGQQDHNVTERTTMEMYYALRRLEKETEWVSYIDGGHGMPTTNLTEARDYHERILDWYRRHLQAEEEAVADGGESGRR